MTWLVSIACANLLRRRHSVKAVVAPAPRRAWALGELLVAAGLRVLGIQDAFRHGRI
jgi:hypothetical protein